MAVSLSIPRVTLQGSAQSGWTPTLELPCVEVSDLIIKKKLRVDGQQNSLMS